MATTSSSALDLLRPDPPVDQKDQPEKPAEEEEDELVSCCHFGIVSLTIGRPGKRQILNYV
jgi:hypothetical protein